MSDCRLPVRPNLEELKHQAKELLRQIRNGEPGATPEFKNIAPRQIAAGHAKLADVQSH
jgi:hypothetical protein